MAEAESTNIDRTCLRLAYQYYYTCTTGRESQISSKRPCSLCYKRGFISNEIGEFKEKRVQISTPLFDTFLIILCNKYAI